MSQNVVVFFNRDVIIIKHLIIAVGSWRRWLFWGGNAFRKMVEVALQKPLRGGGLGRPLLLATSPAINNKYPATWNLSDNPEKIFNVRVRTSLREPFKFCSSILLSRSSMCDHLLQATTSHKRLSFQTPKFSKSNSYHQHFSLKDHLS